MNNRPKITELGPQSPEHILIQTLIPCQACKKTVIQAGGRITYKEEKIEFTVPICCGECKTKKQVSFSIHIEDLPQIEGVTQHDE